MAEAVLAPRSTLLGHTLRTARFREKYGMNVLGIWRAGRPSAPTWAICRWPLAMRSCSRDRAARCPCCTPNRI